MTRSTLTSRLGFAMAAVALFVSLGGDALAQRAMAALKKDAVKSRQIKNGTVRQVDLARAVRAELGVPGPQGPQGPQGPAGPAGPGGGQSELADKSVTNAKLADDAVKGAQVADGSLGSADLGVSSVGATEVAPNAVGPTEMADNAIDANEVANGSLNAVDVGKAAGSVTLDFPSIVKDDCRTLTFDAGVNVDGDAILVTPGGSFPDSFPVTAAVAGGNQVLVVACNRFVADGDPLPVKFAYVVFDV